MPPEVVFCKLCYSSYFLLFRDVVLIFPKRLTSNTSWTVNPRMNSSLSPASAPKFFKVSVTLPAVQTTILSSFTKKKFSNVARMLKNALKNSALTCRSIWPRKPSEPRPFSISSRPSLPFISTTKAHGKTYCDYHSFSANVSRRLASEASALRYRPNAAAYLANRNGG